MRLEAVVRRVAVRLIRVDVAVEVRQTILEKRPACVARTWGARIDVYERHLSDRSGADVRRLRRQPRPDVALNCNVPAVDRSAIQIFWIRGRASAGRQEQFPLTDIRRRYGRDDTLAQRGHRDIRIAVELWHCPGEYARVRVAEVYVARRITRA